jgi:hypothetical protein
MVAGVIGLSCVCDSERAADPLKPVEDLLCACGERVALDGAERLRCEFFSPAWILQIEMNEGLQAVTRLKVIAANRGIVVLITPIADLKAPRRRQFICPWVEAFGVGDMLSRPTKSLARSVEVQSDLRPPIECRRSRVIGHASGDVLSQFGPGGDWGGIAVESEVDPGPVDSGKYFHPLAKVRPDEDDIVFRYGIVSGT